MIEQESFEESDLFFCFNKIVSSQHLEVLISGFIAFLQQCWREFHRQFWQCSSAEEERYQVCGRQISSNKSLYTTDWCFGTFFIFSIQLGIIIPTDFHIFQRDWNHQPDKHGFSKQFAPWMPHNCNLDEFDEDDQAWNFRVPIQIPQKHGHWSSSKGMIWYGRTLRFTNGQPWNLLRDA